MPQTYQEIYIEGISFYNKDIQMLMPLINKGENITLASAPGTGEERFMQYLAYSLEANNAYSVVLVDDWDAARKRISLNIQKSKKKVILIHPYFYRDVPSNSKEILSILTKYGNSKIQAIIKLKPDVHINPGKYSDIATLMPNILVRKPLTWSETEEAIQLRRDLHDWDIPMSKEKDIYLLSGGILRLIKRICGLVDKGEQLTLNSLLKQPSLMVILAELAEIYGNYPLDILRKLGLVDQRGRVVSKLLSAYLDRLSVPPKAELPKKLRILFNFLYENRNKLVTQEQIEDVVSGRYGGTMWSTYKLIDRLKKHLKGRYVIRNVKGKGYILREEE